MIVETAEEAQKRRAAASLAALGANMVFLPADAWILMLLMGALHATFPVVPAIGYGAALVLMLSVLFTVHVAEKFRRPE
ncbi:hypothetical protein [Streptomyces sp. NPDC048603]|uniref:hypothetical protein n=1 Tax=Streptomyces sp. NPDC048603 TaxID=3365577 RepID=UPI003712343A